MRILPHACYGGGVVQRKAGLTSPAHLIEEEAYMRRILFLVTVALVMVGVLAGPA